MNKDRELWTTSLVECLDCHYEWVAVHPLAADDLVCPECYSTDTARSAPSLLTYRDNLDKQA